MSADLHFAEAPVAVTHYGHSCVGWHCWWLVGCYNEYYLQLILAVYFRKSNVAN